MLALPPKKEWQSLHGYVLEHLRYLEHELVVGVPYRTLASAVRAAGFRKVAVRSIRTAVYRARKKRPRLLAEAAPRVGGRLVAVSTPYDSQPQLPAAADDKTAFGRRFRELARPPRPGSEEDDPLI